MRAYLLRSLALLVPTLIGISLLAFGLARLAPGDPATEFLRRTTDRPATPDEIVRTRRELGLDVPVILQYARWAERAASGNLGISYATRRPVTTEIGSRVPATLQLAIPAALLALLIAVPLGAIAALHRNRALDQVARVASLAGASFPSFGLALLLIIIFAVKLSWVPVAGRQGLSSVVLPAITLALTPAAGLARFTRSAMLETLGQEYITTARAKGLREASVVQRHVLRNALIPVVTAFGISIGHLVAGAVIIETIFAWPGLGKLAVDAILQRDYPIIQGFVLYTGLAFILINFVVDLSYAAIDPRVRMGGRRGGARS